MKAWKSCSRSNAIFSNSSIPTQQRSKARFDAATVVLRKVQVSPRKSDIAVGEVALVWAPWRKGADGFPTPAS